MIKPADRRILGLSPRARRVVVPFLVIAAVLVVIAYFSSGRSGESSRAGAVAADPHAAGDPDQRIFESGQRGAGHRADTARWTQRRSLDGKDVIGPSPSGSEAQAAGQGGGLRR